MKITSSIEYATRLMVSLARSYGADAVAAERLSDSEKVPSDYVNQILLRLRRSGLVESRRGAGGGHALARPPAEITLGQVIRAVDGNIFEGVCERYESGKNDCHHESRCAISPVWQKLGGLIEGYLDSVTLAQLLDSGQGCAKPAWLEKMG